MTKTERHNRFKQISREYSDTSILMHEAIARKAGLTGTDHKYLGIIMQKGKMTAGEIAEVTGLTTGAVTGLIDRLEKMHLVKREYDASDRRKVYVLANMKNAQKLLHPLFADLWKKTEELIMSFTEKEIGVIEKYMKSAIQIMNETIKQLKNE
jgi:DNA-binding MarR family transcriptional regulator